MPESMTSAEWVVAGWGFACGTVLTLALLLSYVWRLKAQIPPNGRPTLRQRLAGLTAARYRVVRDAFEELSARIQPVPAPSPRPAAPVVEATGWLSAPPTPLNVPDIAVGPTQDRYAPRFTWTFIDSATGRGYQTVTEVPHPYPVPDEERRDGWPDEDDRPHGRHSADGPTVRLPGVSA